MKILIILPNWLGDALMATPAIEAISSTYPKAEFTFIGSMLSIEALKYHPQCVEAIIDTTKQASSRIYATYQLAKSLGSFDIAISFRNQLHSSLLLNFVNSKVSVAKKSWHSSLLVDKTTHVTQGIHLVKQYVEIIQVAIDEKISTVSPLTLYIEPLKSEKKLLGINPGATYGSAKRWYPERFAQVASKYASTHDILIFGSPNEKESANEIESILRQKHNITNLTNLAGKTTIKELIANIASLDMFVTNDSGPMHVAAAYQIPTVSIFGPTKHIETSQWANEKSKIVRHDMSCAPCMKRECPLKHHECMTSIEASEVIEAIESLK